MKLNPIYNESKLLEFGFKPLITSEKIDALWKDSKNKSNEEVSEIIKLENKLREDNFIVEDEDSVLYYFQNVYVYEIGHSRRGQFYYLLFNVNTKTFEILATEPDGSGGSVELPNILIDLIKNEIIKLEDE